MDLLARRAQMIELKYKDWVLAKPTNEMDPFNDSHLYFGTSETWVSLMVCPALEKYVGECILNLSLRRKGVRLRKSGQAPGREMTSSVLDAVGAWASSGTCAWMMEMEVDANRSFYRSLQILIWSRVFIPAFAVQYDVARSACPIGAPGMPLVFIPSMSSVSGVPFQIDVKVPLCRPRLPPEALGLPKRASLTPCLVTRIEAELLRAELSLVRLFSDLALVCALLDIANFE